MKKITALILAISLLPLALVFSGCSGRSRGEGLSIVSTIFPQYDWVRAILGDTADDHTLTLLVNSGMDFHSYEPSPRDIMTISEADLFIYIGGHSDGWVENALANATNPDMIVINLVEAIGDAVLTLRLTEGMEHVCDDPDCDDASHDAYLPLIKEEHVWTSLLNAKILVEIIADAIIASDPDNADLYRANLTAYLGELNALHGRYEEMVAAASRDTLVFGDRFPFLYLLENYGLNYYAAFTGCSAAAGVSPGTIMILSRRLDDHDLDYIMILEDGNRSIAQGIIDASRNSNRQILTLNSLQSVTVADIEGGMSYLRAMENNLEVLRRALG
jgi:zinc transport system substrate-binding protein